MASAVGTTRGRGDGQSVAPPRERSLLYKAVMTPLIFVTFLISLSWVDYRYSVMRAQYHPQNPTRLPAWLHRILYRYQPYQYVVVDENNRPTGRRADPRYFHSKQRKLMGMEVADAFEIRSAVLVIFGLLSLILMWGVWRAAKYAVDFFMFVR